MGLGNIYRCRKCGNEFFVNFGAGYLFPTESAKITEDIKSGVYGDEIKAAMLADDTLVADAEKHLYICECGKWENEPGLSLFRPKKPGKSRYSYQFYSDLCISFNLAYEYRHICPDCKKPMKQYDSSPETLNCLVCGEKNCAQSNSICWD